MRQAYSILTRLDEYPPKNVTELRALEANAAAAYFRAWRGIPIKWRGTSRRPIPDSWNEIGQRSSPFQLAGNRNASHPVNAILNYAYTVAPATLYGHAVSAIEIVCGMVFTAIMTGLLFVRFSKPRPRILYADQAVVTSHNCSPTLMVRIANGRMTLLTHAMMRLGVLLHEGVYKARRSEPAWPGQHPA